MEDPQPPASLDDLLARLASFMRDRYGLTPECVTARGADGAARSWPFPQPESPCRHSADFRSVRWGSADYAFTATQAAVVRQLWEARDNGTPGVGQETLLEGAGSEADSLRDVFKDHPAWKTLVIPTSGRTYRLADPPSG